MSDATMTRDIAGVHSPRPYLDEKPHAVGAIAFLLVLVGGLGYVVFSIMSDVSQADDHGLAIVRSFFSGSRC
jgi:PiT family inorganic phosphate transporter